jgi:UDP-N-acetylglucosamine 2-epimerase (non-hydrolysing)
LKKIMLVFGTRPEAIKMAPLCHKLMDDRDIKTYICITGQHKDMLEQVMKIFNLKADFNLDIMQPQQDLVDITSSVLIKMREVLEISKPDLVLVHGDTTTSLATSLACFYMGIKVAHVEAGLRTYNLASPFPEEFNRQVTAKISNYHFSPTNLSKQNLISEGINEEKIIVTGNTVIDALQLISSNIDNDEDLYQQITSKLYNNILFNLDQEKFILITGHRRENFGSSFENICKAIRELALEHPKMNFIYPVHLNPNVQAPVNKFLQGIKNIYLLKPLEYQDFVFLLKRCFIVLTDSGGIQEEAPSFGKPVIVMRDTTERPEAVDAGTVKLVGSSKNMIISTINDLLSSQELYDLMSRSHNPYGDGKASIRIIDFLKKVLNDE